MVQRVSNEKLATIWKYILIKYNESRFVDKTKPVVRENLEVSVVILEKI